MEITCTVIENKKTGGRVIYLPKSISTNFTPGKTKCELLDDKLVIPIKNTEEKDYEHSE